MTRRVIIGLKWNWGLFLLPFASFLLLGTGLRESRIVSHPPLLDEPLSSADAWTSVASFISGAVLACLIAFVNQGQVHSFGSAGKDRLSTPWKRFSLAFAVLLSSSLVAAMVHQYFNVQGAQPREGVTYDSVPLIVAFLMFAWVLTFVVLARERTDAKPWVMPNLLAAVWGAVNTIVAAVTYASLFLYDEFRSVMIGVIAGQGLLIFLIMTYREIENGTLGRAPVPDASEYPAAARLQDDRTWNKAVQPAPDVTQGTGRSRIVAGLLLVLVLVSVLVDG